MKQNTITSLLIALVFTCLQKDALSQYKKLNTRELEELRKESNSQTGEPLDLMLILELNISNSETISSMIQELETLLHERTTISLSDQHLKVIVTEKLEKTEYALIKKWLMESNSIIENNQRFYAIKE